MSSKVTAAEHTAIGAFGGIAEVCFMQPMVGIKNALQEGRPIPTNPLHLYRGLLMNCVSIAPITATQFGTNSVLRKYMSPNGAHGGHADILWHGSCPFVYNFLL